MRFNPDGTPIPSSERREWVALLLAPLTTALLIGVILGVALGITLSGSTSETRTATRLRSSTSSTMASDPGPSPSSIDIAASTNQEHGTSTSPLYVIIIPTPTETPSASLLATKAAEKQATVHAEMTSVAYAPTAAALLAADARLTPQPCDSSTPLGTTCIPPTPLPLPTPTPPACAEASEDDLLCVVTGGGWRPIGATPRNTPS